MDQNIFRKTSLNRISSPEEIDEYMKVTKPSLWLTLAAVILLLVGVIIWGFSAKLEGNIEKDGQIVREEISPISFLIN